MGNVYIDELVMLLRKVLAMAEVDMLLWVRYINEVKNITVLGMYCLGRFFTEVGALYSMTGIVRAATTFYAMTKLGAWGEGGNPFIMLK